MVLDVWTSHPEYFRVLLMEMVELLQHLVPGGGFVYMDLFIWTSTKLYKLIRLNLLYVDSKYYLTNKHHFNNFP